MAYIRREELRIYAEQNFEQGQRLEALARVAAQVVTVFLSHSHYDPTLIRWAKTVLLNHRVAVYIDREDGTLPRITSSVTANAIRNRILSCQKFVMVASEQALDSHWIAWELGFADGIRASQSMAILPVREHYGEWQGTEYVGLYPTIQNEGNFWWVIAPDGSRLNYLGEWLTS